MTRIDRINPNRDRSIRVIRTIRVIRQFGSTLPRRLCVALAVAAPLTAAAQREPVLKQVKVPHPYYWREMYVPQVTSGPSAVTWSPDGQEVIYAMQGSLWRQRLGATEARELTERPRIRLPTRLVARRPARRLLVVRW